MRRRAPFDVRSFGGIYAADRLVRGTVVAALQISALNGQDAAVAWIADNDAALGGGWTAFAQAAFRAIVASRSGDFREGLS
jgi:hypothetical protein